MVLKFHQNTEISINILVQYDDDVAETLTTSSILKSCEDIRLYFATSAIGMASNVKTFDENLVGCRVKVQLPKEEMLCEGVVSLHGHTGENLVICTDGVEEILNQKRDHREPVNYGVADKDKETCDPAHDSSNTHPEMVSAMKDYGEELVGCRVKVWRSKSKTSSEGIVASYDLPRKKHLVVYTNGREEMLNLGKHKEQVEDVPVDQARKPHTKARVFHSMSSDNDMDAHLHARKKHKDLSIDLTIPSPSSVVSKLPILPGEDDLVNINGYKVKPTTAPILEAIFAKYGDITAHCSYKSSSVRASLLEVICNIVQKLQYYELEAILSNLEDIETEISDVEASKIKVSWLHEHIAKVRKFAICIDKSMQLRKTKAKSGIVTKVATREMKERYGELVMAEKKFKEAEKRVNAMRLVNRKIEDEVLESEYEGYFLKRQLDDLL